MSAAGKFSDFCSYESSDPDQIIHMVLLRGENLSTP